VEKEVVEEKVEETFWSRNGFVLGLLGVLLFFGFVLHFFSFEETVIREQGLEKTLRCVEWSQPFEPSLEKWKSRDLLWSVSWNDPESGSVWMAECMFVDFGYRFREDFNRSVVE